MRIYIAYHDTSSQVEAERLAAKWMKCTENLNVCCILLEQTPYCESNIYEYLSKVSHEWNKEDYVGIVTYSIESKLSTFSKKQISIDWTKIRNDAISKHADVVGLFRMVYYKNNEQLSLLNGAVLQHGLDFLNAWNALLKTMGFKECEILDESIKGFYCNWWLSTPNLLMEYIGFYHACKKMIDNSTYLQSLLKKNALYTNHSMTKNQLNLLFGADYYMLHPFIFERLPCFYFHQRKHVVGYVCTFQVNLF